MRNRLSPLTLAALIALGLAALAACAGPNLSAEQYVAKLETLAAEYVAALDAKDPGKAAKVLEEFRTSSDPAAYGLKDASFTTDQQSRIAAAAARVNVAALGSLGSELGHDFGQALGSTLGKGLGDFFGSFSKEFTEAFEKSSGKPLTAPEPPKAGE